MYPFLGYVMDLLFSVTPSTLPTTWVCCIHPSPLSLQIIHASGSISEARSLWETHTDQTPNLPDFQLSTSALQASSPQAPTSSHIRHVDQPFLFTSNRNPEPPDLSTSQGAVDTPIK